MVTTKVTQAVKTIIARLDPGEDVLETLESLVLEHNVHAGHMMLIGAISGATLGYFDIHKKEYRSFTISEDLEVTSCIGNVAFTKDGTPIVHAHMVVADEKGASYSGHLMKGCIVSVTIEVVLTVLGGELLRVVDDRFGLNLLKLH
ncbi:MAG: DNA-binding protein [Candidatus Thorarchaeota archaeon]|nr:DNA-binding protein [Candidatus Thorarchaeota archaeon]